MTQKWCWQTKAKKICKISQRNKSSKILNEPIGSQLSTETPLPHQHHLFYLPKLQTGTCRKKLNLQLLKLTRKVSQQYLSRRCTHRADLKQQDSSIQGYVKFLATRMIKRTGERKYSLEKEF